LAGVEKHERYEKLKRLYTEQVEDYQNILKSL